MALIDIDRHILTELVILQEKMRKYAAEFRQQWGIITYVRIQTELIVLGDKNADHASLPKMRTRIVRAMKACDTRMLLMDDCMSKIQVLMTHMVSEVKEADTGKGTESAKTH